MNVTIAIAILVFIFTVSVITTLIAIRVSRVKPKDIGWQRKENHFIAYTQRHGTFCAKITDINSGKLKKIYSGDMLSLQKKVSDQIKTSL